MTPYPRPEKRPHNLCRSCSQDFNSVDLFERHRVGDHAFTYSEGARMDPPREDGRRCLSVDEMREKGWQPNDKGYWIDPLKVADARARLGRAVRDPASAPEGLAAEDEGNPFEETA